MFRKRAKALTRSFASEEHDSLKVAVSFAVLGTIGLLPSTVTGIDDGDTVDRDSGICRPGDMSILHSQRLTISCALISGVDELLLLYSNHWATGSNVGQPDTTICCARSSLSSWKECAITAALSFDGGTTYCLEVGAVVQFVTCLVLDALRVMLEFANSTKYTSSRPGRSGRDF